MARVRIYHRLVRQEDIPALQVACKTLFNFDDTEISLQDLVESERWLCLASVQATSAGEDIVGFVAAAVGQVSEFVQEAATLSTYLAATCEQHLAAQSTTYDTQDTPLTSSATATAATTGSAAAAAAGGGEASPSDSILPAAGLSADPLAAEVVLLGVQEAFRRQGVATRLLARTRSFARSRGAELMFLHVQASNHAAKRLYAKQGFQLVASLPGYYQQQLQQDTLMDDSAARTSKSSSSGPESSSSSSLAGMSAGSVSLSSLSSLSSCDGAGNAASARSQGLRAALTAGMARSSSNSSISRTGALWDPTYHTSPDAELQVAVLVPQLAAAAAAAAAEAQEQLQLQQQAQDRTAAAHRQSVSNPGTSLSTAAAAAAAAASPLLPRFTGSSSSSSVDASSVGASGRSSNSSSNASSRRKAEWVELPAAPAPEPATQQQESKAAAVMGVLMGAFGSVLGLGPRNRQPPVRRGRRLQVGGEDMLLVKGEDGEVYIMDEEESLTPAQREQQEQQQPGASPSSSNSRSSSSNSDSDTSIACAAPTADTPQITANSSNIRTGAMAQPRRSSGPDCPALRRGHSSVGSQLYRGRTQLHGAKLAQRRAATALHCQAASRSLCTSLSRL